MKEKISIEYMRRLRLILKSKLNGRNRIMTVKYGAGNLKWNADKLKV